MTGKPVVLDLQRVGAAAVRILMLLQQEQTQSLWGLDTAGCEDPHSVAQSSAVGGAGIGRCAAAAGAEDLQPLVVFDAKQYNMSVSMRMRDVVYRIGAFKLLEDYERTDQPIRIFAQYMCDVERVSSRKVTTFSCTKHILAKKLQMYKAAAAVRKRRGGTVFTGDVLQSEKIALRIAYFCWRI